MADAVTNIVLDDLTEAIAAQIKAQYPQLETCQFYCPIRKDLPVPACLLDLEKWQEFDSPDPGTEQQAVEGHFSARFVFDGINENESKRAIRALCAAFTAFLHVKRWTGFPTGPAEFTDAYKDDFHPLLDQYEVWCVEWKQVLHLGNTVWVAGSPAPTVVYAGVAPDIGPGNESKYTVVN